METKIEFVKGDITQVRTEAIVNAANRTLLGGGGVDGAIHRAAGAQLLQECKGLGGCETGRAKITQGYKLPARYVIHTVGPVWRGGCAGEAELLAGCYRSCMDLAQEYGLKTIAFPSISTGAYGFPVEKAAPIAYRAVTSFLRDNPAVFDRVIFVLFSDRDLKVYDNCRQTAGQD